MMNFRSFKYHLDEGTKSLFKNRRMSVASIASVAICISLLITSLCIAINLDSSLENLERNIGIVLYLGEDVTTDQSRELLEQLSSIDNISNITYTSKEDALKWAKAQWGEDSSILSGFEEDNPFPRSFEIEIDTIKNQDLVLEEVKKIQKNFEIKFLTAMEVDRLELEMSLDISYLQENSDDSSFESVETEDFIENVDESEEESIQEMVANSVIEQINSPNYQYMGIEKISHSKKEADILMSLSTTMRIISIVLILALAVISVIIIFNTIKITVYVRREEINIMKYVGATNSFIRVPFIIEGILIGLIGAIIPSLICFFIYLKTVSIISSNPYLYSIIDLKPAFELFLVITPISLILGVLLGTVGSVNSIKKHLDV